MQYRYWYVYDCMFSEFGMMPDARTVCVQSHFYKSFSRQVSHHQRRQRASQGLDPK